MSELDITNGARFGLIYILSTLELGNLKKDFSITCIKKRNIWIYHNTTKSIGALTENTLLRSETFTLSVTGLDHHHLVFIHGVRFTKSNLYTTGICNGFVSIR